MLLTLKGVAQEPEQINHNFIVPASVMKGTGDQVSIFLALSLLTFLVLKFRISIKCGHQLTSDVVKVICTLFLTTV